ncbi:hypothetical protein UO65_2962 [Actinokineospora spheciospongiae]|uniref:PE domain-containing protein n=1 Tax=Actinokineospora spheciospongiae TaxID=909613 RepID=W7ILK1_9PSEU|nr:hypothetical protein [Actinokineospora spheciospongiae]EWC61775.1 hypothetical protein UO65_2962 [Actinokineospora spheciospongiae]
MYIDEGAGAPLDAIGKSMDAFTQSAAAGQFAVNQSGGDALLAAIAKMTDWIDSKMGALGILDQEPQLGSSNAAEVIKPYSRNVASDEQGFLTQLRAFRESLTKADEAIRTAMNNYRATDEANASKLA